MVGEKGMGCAKPGQGADTVMGQIEKALMTSGLTIWIEAGLDPPKPTRVLSKPTKKSSIATRWFPLLPNVERTGVSGGDGVARQCAPVGDPLNNEQ